ncbi:MAG: WD40 repeat domain-containing protein [Candidatus Poribacteria bacterium]|nr:WD40 repeat domain-containing protein [Candidatus Poribacteria bacterium]
MYDRSSLKPVALFDEENGMVSAVIFSHDNQLITTSNSDGVMKVWDTQTLQCLAKIDHRENVGATSGRFINLCFSQDNQYLAASSFDKQNVVYEWRKNIEASFTNFPIDVEDTVGHSFPICFSPIGNLIAYVSSGNTNHTITITDIETDEHIAQLNCLAPLAYQGLVFSPCGQYIAVANQNNEVLVWDVYNNALRMEPTAYNGKRLIPAYTPDGMLRVAELYDNKVAIWDAIQKEKLDTFGRISTAHLRFSTDGARIATILSRSELCVWTVGNPSTKVTSPADHKPVPHSVAFSNKGKTLASGHAFGMYHVFWNVAQRKTEQIFPTPKIQAQRTALTENLTAEEKQQWYRLSAVSPCEERLALRDLPRGAVEIWDIVSETLITKLSDSNLSRSWRATSFSSTGEHFISSARTGDIDVWNTQSGEKINTLPGDNRDILTTAFHPDGRQLAVVPRGSSGMLWDIVTREQIGVFPTELPEDISVYRGDPEQIHQYIEKYKKIGDRYKCCPLKLTFSPCGTMIACGIQEHIRLRDAVTLETRMLILLPETCSRPFALTFSPCGKYLISGAWWRKGLEKVSIRIWEVATGQNIHTFCAHTTDVQDLAFTPDGKILASSSYDGTILLWDMKPFIGT